MKTAILSVVLFSITCLSHGIEPSLYESPRTTPTQPVPGMALAEFLPHTVWHPTEKNNPCRSLTFTTDGRMHVAVSSGGGMIRYEIADGDSILCRKGARGEFRGAFSNDRKPLTIAGRTYTLQPHLHSAFSDLVSQQ